MVTGGPAGPPPPPPLAITDVPKAEGSAVPVQGPGVVRQPLASPPPIVDRASQYRARAYKAREEVMAGAQGSGPLEAATEEHQADEVIADSDLEFDDGSSASAGEEWDAVKTFLDVSQLSPDLDPDAVEDFLAPLRWAAQMRTVPTQQLKGYDWRQWAICTIIECIRQLERDCVVEEEKATLFLEAHTE